MAEIALRTTERRLVRDGHLFLRPVGSTIVCLSDAMIRRKWIEICCDLVAPYKRDRYTGIPGWKELCEAWTPQLREAWLDADRPTEKHRLSRLLEDRTYPATVWGDIVVPTGIVAALPNAPESTVNISDSWMWSEAERKRYLVVCNTDADDETVEGWQGVEERLASGTPATVWRKQINYKTELGISAGTLAAIADPEVVVHPKFSSPVAAAKVVQPIAALLSGGG